jgi:hypothetical protein
MKYSYYFGMNGHSNMKVHTVAYKYDTNISYLNTHRLVSSILQKKKSCFNAISLETVFISRKCKSWNIQFCSINELLSDRRLLFGAIRAYTHTHTHTNGNERNIFFSNGLLVERYTGMFFCYIQENYLKLGKWLQVNTTITYYQSDEVYFCSYYSCKNPL